MSRLLDKPEVAAAAADAGDLVSAAELERLMLLETHGSANNRWLLAQLKEIWQEVPVEAWAELPSDLSTNLDHYLYRSAK